MSNLLDELALTESINANIKVLENEISKHSKTFKQEDFFTFSNIEERKEAYKKEYFAFLLNIKNTLSDLSSNMVGISSLLLEVDREGNVEKIEIYNRIFFAYLDFQKTVSEYTKITEKELSKKEPSVSALTGALEKFKLACASLLASL